MRNGGSDASDRSSPKPTTSLGLQRARGLWECEAKGSGFFLALGEVSKKSKCAEASNKKFGPIMTFISSYLKNVNALGMHLGVGVKGC